MSHRTTPPLGPIDDPLKGACNSLGEAIGGGQAALGVPVGCCEMIVFRGREDIQISHRARPFGTDEAVWCVTEPSRRVSLWKCKPERIEAIHRATGINKQTVLAISWHAPGKVDVLSFETVWPLLLEEYEPEEVDTFRPLVRGPREPAE